MHVDPALQLKLGDASKALAQDFFLDLNLMLVAGVLVLASTATFIVGTAGLDAMGRGFEDCLSGGAGEAGLLLGEVRLNFLAIQHERNEYSFAGSAVIGRQAGEAVAAIDQLFNCQEQEMILRHEQEAQLRTAQANPSGCFPAASCPVTSRVFKSTTATLSAVLTAT